MGRVHFVENKFQNFKIFKCQSLTETPFCIFCHFYLSNDVQLNVVIRKENRGLFNSFFNTLKLTYVVLFCLSVFLSFYLSFFHFVLPSFLTCLYLFKCKMALLLFIRRAFELRKMFI